MAHCGGPFGNAKGLEVKVLGGRPRSLERGLLHLNVVLDHAPDQERDLLIKIFLRGDILPDQEEDVLRDQMGSLLPDRREVS